MLHFVSDNQTANSSIPSSQSYKLDGKRHILGKAQPLFQIKIQHLYFLPLQKPFSPTSSRRLAKRTHSFLFLDLDGILSK